jgi:hypothetical protein
MFDDAGAPPSASKTTPTRARGRKFGGASLVQKTMPDEDELGVRHVHYADLQKLDLGDMKSWVTRPLAKDGGVVKCFVKVPRNSSSSSQKAEFFIQKGQDHEMVLVGQKQPRCVCYSCLCPRYYSKYTVQTPAGEAMGEVCAKSSTVSQSNNFEIRSNMVGGSGSDIFGAEAPRSMGMVRYKESCETLCCCDTWANMCLICDIFLAPRRMTFDIPAADSNGGSNFRQKKNRGGVAGHTHKMINMPPVWDGESGAHVLDFRGRVTRTSQNNFQLVERSLLDKTARVQFGLAEPGVINSMHTLGSNSNCNSNSNSKPSASAFEIFTLDFMYPFSPLQAFCLALTSLDRGCDISS